VTATPLDFGFGLFGPSLGEKPEPAAPKLSVAVLPLASMRTNAEDQALADGITEDVIDGLSRISDAVVIGRSTMFTYKGRQVDPRKVGRELNVRHVLEGTLRRTHENLRIDLQLVEAATGAQVWSERIDQPAANWQALSDTVAGRIARTLNLELMYASSRWVSRPSGMALPAAELAMRGWVELFNKPQTRETNETALRWLNEALALDRELSLAWTGLAYATYRAASFGWCEDSIVEGCRKAIELAQHALELDPRSADAHYVTGQSLNGLGELEQAEEKHRTCIALNPSHAPAYGALGQGRLFRGFPNETAIHCGRAFALSPREPLRAIWLRSMALAALFTADPSGAAEHARAALAINPKYPSPYLILACANLRLGLTAAAHEALKSSFDYTEWRSITEIREWHARPKGIWYTERLEEMLSDLRCLGVPD
jgi:adenylate cyclase